MNCSLTLQPEPESIQLCYCIAFFFISFMCAWFAPVSLQQLHPIYFTMALDSTWSSPACTLGIENDSHQAVCSIRMRFMIMHRRFRASTRPTAAVHQQRRGGMYFLLTQCVHFFILYFVLGLEPVPTEIMISLSPYRTYNGYRKM